MTHLDGGNEKVAVVHVRPICLGICTFREHQSSLSKTFSAALTDAYVYVLCVCVKVKIKYNIE